MKILHTADWHLGKKLGSIYRIDEQKIVLQEICEIANNQNVDAVVIAGDLFDAFNPPTEAVELFYSTLKKLSNNGARPVIAIAGNHDSPDRIEAPNPLALLNGIFFIGYPKFVFPQFHADLPFTVSKSDESFLEITLPSKELLRIITAPFANEFRLQEAFMTNKDAELVSFLTDFWQKIADSYCDNNGVNIFIGHHLFLPTSDSPIEEPEDEKPIQAISALLPFTCIPQQIQYVALGHLHRFQTIHKNPPIVYSGSPLAYSFSEANQAKHVAIVELEANKPAKTEKIQLHTPLLLVRKIFNSCNDAIIWLQENQNVYVELTIISDSYLQPSDIKAIYDAHSGIVAIIPQVTVIQSNQEKAIEISYDKSMEELFEDYFMSKKNGQKPNDELKKMFRKIIAEN